MPSVSSMAARLWEGLGVSRDRNGTAGQLLPRKWALSGLGQWLLTDWIRIVSNIGF